MSAFKISERRNNSTLELKISGGLDEDVKLPQINFSQFTTIIFDFSETTSINSCGIRDWIKWISYITPSTKPIYSRCPKIIVDQINMVDGFLPISGKVDSFYVPYYCESCDNVENKLFLSTDVPPKTSRPIPEKIKCAKCGKDSEIDVIEAKYLKFLNR